MTTEVIGLEDFLEGYIGAALWSSNDESDESGGVPLDDNYSDDDLSPEALASMTADCVKFLTDNGHLITDENYLRPLVDAPSVYAQAGHDFWLTRHHHGVGFWDGDWAEEVGEKLTEAAQSFHETDIIVGEDGQLHI